MSSSWMFGGGEEDTPRENRRTGNRAVVEPEEGYLGLQIGSDSGDRETVFRSKKAAQQAYIEQLNRDRAIAERLKQEISAKEESRYASDVLSGSGAGVTMIGAASSQVLTDRSALRAQLAEKEREIVIRKISEESSPLNSPRYRQLQQHIESATEHEFCIGESEAIVRSRKAAQKLAYLAQLDADSGNARQPVTFAPVNKAWEYDSVSNGITGLQIGSGKPTLDMSPSLKNLYVDSKKQAQLTYRAQLEEQQAAATQIKTDRKLASAAAAAASISDPLPYMRY
jgi:hypothetical protein